MSDRPPLRPNDGGASRRTPRYDRNADTAATPADRVRDRLESEARERDRAYRRRTLIGAVAAVAVIAVVAVIAAVVLVDQPSSAPPAVAQPTDVLGSDGAGIPGAADAAFSPNGTHLAVRLGGGALGVAVNGRLQRVVPAETQITAFSWFGTSQLLVQEGPVSTGQLAVVAVDGTDRGGLRLSPDVGPGNGIAVNDDGDVAVLVSFGVVDFPGQPTPVDLWVAELPGGATRALTSTPSVVESDPHFVDDGRVAVVVRDGDDVAVVVIDVATGAATPLFDASADTRILGVVGIGNGREIVWNDESTIRATRLGDGSSRQLGRVPAGTRPLTVDPAAQRVVVRETDPSGANSQLRLIEL